MTSRSLAGKTLADLARLEAARGVFLRSLTRAGQEMPLAPNTRIDRGDVLRLIGIRSEVERVVKELGYADRPTTETDMVFVGTGIVLGGFVGLLAITIAGIPLTLTASGGALVMGLVFGWLRAVCRSRYVESGHRLCTAKDWVPTCGGATSGRLTPRPRAPASPGSPGRAPP